MGMGNRREHVATASSPPLCLLLSSPGLRLLASLYASFLRVGVSLLLSCCFACFLLSVFAVFLFSCRVVWRRAKGHVRGRLAIVGRSISLVARLLSARVLMYGGLFDGWMFSSLSLVSILPVCLPVIPCCSLLYARPAPSLLCSDVCLFARNARSPSLPA